jgi:hypothetical protein
VNSPFLEHRVPELLDEVVAMYRAAGRPLASLTEGDLDAHFVDTVEAYIADPRNPARFRAVNDVAAEYVLRRRAAPGERVVRLKEGAEIAGNQPHKPKLVVWLDRLPGYEDLDLPMVVLAFGRQAVIPALGAILQPEGSDRWDKGDSGEFRWLLGPSAPHSERVVNLDAARAKRVAGKPGVPTLQV